MECADRKIVSESVGGDVLGCHGVRSVRAANAFFAYVGAGRRLHSRMELNKILQMVHMYLYTNHTLWKAAFNISVSKMTLVDWWQSIRTTCGKALESVPLFEGTEEFPVEVDEGKEAGSVKYHRGRSLVGDLGDLSEDELELSD